MRGGRTDYLDLSVGGTLAVGGVGPTTHRHGLQTDNVHELEVVTGAGEVVVCSPREHRELFDAVRAGPGQFGIVTRAVLGLVPAPERVRRYVLAYSDARELAADQRELLRNRRPDLLQGAVLPDGDGRRHELDMAVFHPADRPPDDAARLAGLADDRPRMLVQDLGHHQYVELFDGFVEALRATGEWARPHPWLLTFLPAATAEDVLRGTLDDLAPCALGGLGRVLTYPVTTHAMTTPLARVPDGPEVVVHNVIRSAPDGPAQVGRMLDWNRRAYERVRAAGGTLYPVSALQLTTEEWARHFGPAWPAVRAARQRFDPADVLTPGYPGL